MSVLECNKGLKATALKMVRAGKGILAADEATKNFWKTLSTINVESTTENRRRYRELLIEIPNLSDYICGVILNRETVEQKHKSGRLFLEILAEKDIVVGVTLDNGPVPFHGGRPDETSTEGLEDLDEECKKYKRMGCGFAKWREIYKISADTPSDLNIMANSITLARYASICQANGLVPIIEPDVVRDGDHDLTKSSRVCRKVWAALYKALNDFNVYLPGTILKTNMVTPGANCNLQHTPADVAKFTVDTLGDTIPPSCPGIVFLSGGQTEVEATENLKAINQYKPDFLVPWKLTFCYGRALQASALKAWMGKDENVPEAQEEMMKRAKANSHAALGEDCP